MIRKTKIPDSVKRLPNGTQLSLWRAVKLTRDENNEVIIGDWLVALQPGKPRIVAFFYKKDEKQIVEMIYDTHTMKYGEREDIPLPEILEYRFCDIDDPNERQECLNLYGQIV